MLIDVVTIFPSMFDGPLQESMLYKARVNEIVKIEIHNLRDFSEDKHRKVDDYPYGGGPGMIMKPEPFFHCVNFIKNKRRAEEGIKSSKVILMSPQGTVLNQQKVCELSGLEHLIVLCGHYEGVDERVRVYLVDEELSIGDFILTGGELPAMVLIDAVVRLIPGVLNDNSLREESFSDGGLLEYPQYTRPREFNGMAVPEVLLSGNHEKVKQWRYQESLRKTKERRPELLQESNNSGWKT